MGQVVGKPVEEHLISRSTRPTGMFGFTIIWIGQVISLIDIEYKFYSKFEIYKLNEGPDGFQLEGAAWGEDIDHEKHVTRTEVKAMTYADLRIETEQDITRIWFTLDL